MEVAEAIGRLLDPVSDRAVLNEQLESSEEQRRQSERMNEVGQLAGGIAHDFNNLLQVITGFSEFARDGFEPEDPRFESLARVQQAGEKTAALTRQLIQ